MADSREQCPHGFAKPSWDNGAEYLWRPVPTIPIKDCRDCPACLRATLEGLQDAVRRVFSMTDVQLYEKARLDLLRVWNESLKV